MMLKWFLIAGVLLFAACQSAAPPETPTPAPTLTPSLPLITEEPEATPGWLETEMNGVSLGMWQPNGWETDQSHGLVLAEQPMEGGLLVYCFVPPLDEFHVSSSDDLNFALAVLNEVVNMPSHTGRDVVVSRPVGFEWDNHQAAYYLLTTGDSMRALVLALALSSERKVVVCNLSISSTESVRIRTITPQLLDGLTVDGETLHGSALDALPDPLPFPRYSYASSRAVQPTMTNGAP